MTLTVAIHQPNHLPWLGYFAKIARSDIFVFLDDAQYPKGSYVNRVRIAADGEPFWLTIPVKVTLGDPILKVESARSDWARAHRDRLIQIYRSANFFKETWPEIEKWLRATPSANLAQLNMHLVSMIAQQLGLGARFVTSSSLDLPAATSDIRLAAIVDQLAPGGRYLSGAGGANYQSEQTFAERGISLAYNDFAPLPYDRSGAAFLPGLSILDAVFHRGWDETRLMIAPTS